MYDDLLLRLCVMTTMAAIALVVAKLTGLN